jgi:hypothetical protein
MFRGNLHQIQSNTCKTTHYHPRKNYKTVKQFLKSHTSRIGKEVPKKEGAKRLASEQTFKASLAKLRLKLEKEYNTKYR